LSRQPYPEGIDCIWLASDCKGHVGAFITAGAGPIPTEALRSVYLSVEDIESQLVYLPSISQTELLVSVPRPDDFIALAERGLFVYDWTDIHRTAGAQLRVYEPVAVPTQPLSASSLPADLAILAKALRLAGVAFAATAVVDIRAHLSCVETETEQ